MKRILLVIFVYLALSSSLFSMVRLSCDPTESSISFRSKLLSMFEIAGTFGSMSVDIDLIDTQKINQINVRIDTNSINTKNKTRDRDLRGHKFFDSVNYPFITFSVNQVVDISQEKVIGFLTINGIKKEVSIPVEMQYFKNEGTNQYVLSLKSKDIILSRNDFKVSGYPFLISDDVIVNFDVFLKVYISPT